MIAVRLMGGLGNQMFQYALGRRLSLDRGTELILDLSHYENQPPDEVPRYFELNCYNLSAKLGRNALDKPTIKNHLLKSPKLKVIKEKGLNFDPKILNSPDNCLLVGHWISEKYFIGQASQIRKDFTLKEPLSRNKKLVANKIALAQNSVAVQVRRGDFVSHPGSSRYHGTVPLDYYQRAVNEIAKSVKSPHLFVISDDPEWCRHNLKMPYPTDFVDHIPGTGYEDMNLISRCDHHIIANSTFGWWGAWLNNKKGKIVISPAKWLKDTSVKTPDLLPSEWIKL